MSPVRVLGEHAETPLAACVAGALKPLQIDPPPAAPATVRVPVLMR